MTKAIPGFRNRSGWIHTPWFGSRRWWKSRGRHRMNTSVFPVVFFFFYKSLFVSFQFFVVYFVCFFRWFNYGTIRVYRRVAGSTTTTTRLRHHHQRSGGGVSSSTSSGGVAGTGYRRRDDRLHLFTTISTTIVITIRMAAARLIRTATTFQ